MAVPSTVGYCKSVIIVVGYYCSGAVRSRLAFATHPPAVGYCALQALREIFRRRRATGPWPPVSGGPAAAMAAARGSTVSPSDRAAETDTVGVRRLESRDSHKAANRPAARPLLSALPRWPRGAGKAPRSSSARPSSLVVAMFLHMTRAPMASSMQLLPVRAEVEAHEEDEEHAVHHIPDEHRHGLSAAASFCEFEHRPPSVQPGRTHVVEPVPGATDYAHEELGDL